MMSLLMKILSIKQTLIITSKCFNAIQSEKSCNCQVFLIFRFTLEKKRNIQVYITCKFEKINTTINSLYAQRYIIDQVFLKCMK